MYKGILVVGAFYDKIKKLIKKLPGELFLIFVSICKIFNRLLRALKIIKKNVFEKTCPQISKVGSLIAQR